MGQTTAVLPPPAQTRFERPLDPIERVSEALFGLIMVLTVTCSISVATADRKEVRTMLLGVIGANLVWGVIDAVLYLMASLVERREGIDTLHSVHHAVDAAEGRRIIADALPSVVASVLQPEDLERLRQELNRLPEPSLHLRLRDWLGALGVFLWVFLIIFPVALPFVFIDDAHRALRLSNAVAVLLLFLTGYAFGRAAGLSRWWTGLVMVVIGGALVAATIALGG